jgi:hypothetical protein
MTRTEHLAWCKKRALEYCDAGDPMQALTSMFSDLGKHEETKGHIAINLGMQMMMGGMLSSVSEARRFIEGFN